MVSVKVAILDDENKDIENVKRYFEKIKEIDYQCTYFNNETHLFEEVYDLYILDIEMPDTNGLDVAEKIKELYPHSVIMLHSKRNDLVFESFKIGVFFFIRKDNFEEDMDYARIRLDKHFISNNLIYKYRNKDIIKNISHQNITYIEKIDHHVEIHLDDNSILIDKTSMRNIIPQFNEFIQCHQSYLVNLNHVESLDEKDFIMKNKDRIQISKRNYMKVRKVYIDYLNKKVTL